MTDYKLVPGRQTAAFVTLSVVPKMRLWVPQNKTFQPRHSMYAIYAYIGVVLGVMAYMECLGKSNIMVHTRLTSKCEDDGRMRI